jgi:hypothetical protein
MTLEEAKKELERADNEYWDTRAAYHEARDKMDEAHNKFAAANDVVWQLQRMEFEPCSEKK